MGINLFPIASQRDVFLLPHPFDSKVDFHPFIVLSTQEANEYENTFTAVMITSSEYRRDDFSFDLVNEMFDHPLPKTNCHVRMHLLTLCLTEEIRGNKLNRMKEVYFKQLMLAIGDLIFNYDFLPK